MKQAVPLSRYLVFFSLAAGGCALDLATKSWMFATLGMPGPESQTWWIWPDVLGFQTTLNAGALFGMGQGMSLLFAALSIGAALGILIWLFAVGAAHDGLLTVALGFVTAGICGNLYDRLSPLHAVRDFIHVMIGTWPWPNFNLADSCLVCGAALLAWHAFFGKSEPETEH